MAILEDLTKGPVPVIVGLGIAVAVPTVIPAMGSVLRPLAKVMMKGALSLFDALKEGIAEVGEQVSDIVVETRAEMAHSAREVMPGTDEESITKKRPHHRRYRA